MIRILTALTTLTWAVTAQAAHTFNCTYSGGDSIKDASRVSRKMELSIDKNEATLKGVIWDKNTSDSGKRQKKDKNGQADYVGFEKINDDNVETHVFADLGLIDGEDGNIAVWGLGDTEDSANYRYVYSCKAK